ncbi:MAG: glycosyl hydrolase [Candidatus Nephthysia bennettiae]|uniref:Glycoside hydrolase family 3 C-terminal domain-containing protein n=1 Tax=Candidatus Nephthysia bennettiae TaxID=3127016 RepID=A0A934K7R8_9BACT|nr:glycoside hydrolase family 3 C-terminal domain-containing protein [Candidatus Dormibacteraeota bacterium]MBJ7614306.1 glycoside hydrolase family 3 C-terminal domain-containing protein [Candidatus Dormibacteraeota bacterium]PZR99841.1 MAG: glycosyl hydrolase [Candidatus Dormibacteraeota bacterium]
MATEDRTAVTGSEEHIEHLLGQLTLEEKAALIVGRDSWTTAPVERLGIPSVWLSDGPTGLRKSYSGTDMGVGTSVPATCFPTESALGASWDSELVMRVAAAIAVESQAEGVQVLLGPGINLKRSPLCGRNFEYLSEDPMLAGTLAAAFITGLQEVGVGASLKHLVANESETDRMITDSVVEERALRELYLRAFEIAIARSDPWTLMAAYNRLNGTYCTENAQLLREIVEGEWGYRGIVMSDWFAINDRVAALDAGLHLQMPTAPTAPGVVAAVRNGVLDEGRLDEIVRALLAFIFKADAARRPDTRADLDAHHRLAREAAGQCVVLLKNEGSLLPLEGEALTEVALIGTFAAEPRFQGAGSSQVVPARPVESIHQELVRLLGDGGRVTYAPGHGESGEAGADRVAEAQEAAQRSSVAVVVIGLPASYEEEGADRKHIDLPPEHNALVEAVLEVQPRTVVVLLNGSAVAMPWAERAPALLEGWLGGQGGGGAIAEALLGRVNPSGKLGETFPVRLEDTPAYLTFPHDGTDRVPFCEGLFCGYRWYDARRITPLFPFGHGLSYTTFEYSSLAVETVEEGVGEPLRVSVSLRVRNTGARNGREVVHLYVRERQPRLTRPDKELKAFAKVSLEPQEETEVTFELGERDFAFYDPRPQAWTVTGGVFDLLVGASSRDIRLEGSVTLQGTATQLPLGRLSPLREWLAHPAARDRIQPALSAMVEQLFSPHPERGEAPEMPDLAHSFVGDMPLAKLVMVGTLSEQDLAELIEVVNRERR